MVENGRGRLLGARGLLVGALVTGLAVLAAFAIQQAFDDPEGSEPGPVNRSDVDLPEPRVIERGGVRYEITPITPDAVVVDPRDPRTLTVYALDTAAEEDPACSVREPVARLEAESDGEVRLATFAYTAPSTDAEKLCGYATTSEGGGMSSHRELQVRLAQPLGSRRVVDAATGGVFGMIPASYRAVPSYLPTGYRKVFTSRYRPEDLFQATSQYAPSGELGGTPSLMVALDSATPALPRDGTVVGRRPLGDLMVEITESPYSRCATWVPRGGVVASVCSSGRRSELLPVSELLRVARSVPVPDPG